MLKKIGLPIRTSSSNPDKPVMSENPSPSWTPSEEQQLHYVDFVAEVLRRFVVVKPAEKPKPRWQRFLESTGGAALITVLIGGIAGGYITYKFQSRQKDRDLQQAILKTRTEQALLSYKEYLDKREEIDKTAYELLATCISTSDHLIDAFTRSDFNPQGRTGDSLKEALKKRDDAKNAYEDASNKWQNQAQVTGLILAQYHDNNPDVATKWDAVRVSMDDYIRCAESCFLAGTSGCGCKENTKNLLKENLTSFHTAVARSRDLFWKRNLCDNNANALCQP
jgi:hypothetical protein